MVKYAIITFLRKFSVFTDTTQSEIAPPQPSQKQCTGSCVVSHGGAEFKIQACNCGASDR
jgi:hypothetical protein